MEPLDSSDDLAAKLKKGMNRIAIPLKLLETDTTLQYVQNRYSLKNNWLLVKLLKRFNQGLYVLIGLAALFVLVEAVYLDHRDLRLPTIVASVPSDAAANNSFEADRKWEELQRFMDQRSIFEPLAIVASAEKVAFEQEILQRIRIIGVMLDANPQAIIEMIASGETVFVSRGAEVAGAIVKDIFENKVILTYNGTELELLR